MDNTNIELEEMRRQLSLLKDKLNQEEIVNDRLLRESMNSKAATINRQATWSVVSAVFVIVMMLVYFPLTGLEFSLLFRVATSVYMIVCIYYTWRYHRNINSQTMNGDLLTVAEVMRKLKHNYQTWLKFAIPSVIVWFAWLGYEAISCFDNPGMAVTFIVSGLAGGIIGGIVGLKMHKKVVDSCDEIIKMLKSHD